MKHLVLLSFFILCIQSLCSAQTDTITQYLSLFGDTTHADAYSFTKFRQTEEGWYAREYFVSNGRLKSEGGYRNTDFDSPVGTIKNYSEKGKLFNTVTYSDSSSLERTYFYEDGKQKAHVTYLGYGKMEQKCWDPAENEALICQPIEIAASFKGGAEGWRRYLEKHLDAAIPAKIGAPAAQYTVQVRFAVDKNGELKNIRATKIPQHCEPCVTEVIRLLKAGPTWQPTTLDGVPVIHFSTQYITLVIDEDDRRMNKKKRPSQSED